MQNELLMKMGKSPSISYQNDVCHKYGKNDTSPVLPVMNGIVLFLILHICARAQSISQHVDAR